jgi:hypothetical protein
MTIEIGSVVNMKTFAHVTGTMTWHYKKPGKDETYVFMFMGTEKDGEALDLIAVMNKLGWRAPA